MRVSELMSRDVVTIGDTETCYEAVEQICHRKVRHLPVLDREGALVGIVTDRDVRHRLFAPDVYRQKGPAQGAPAAGTRAGRDVGAGPARRRGGGRGGGGHANASREGGLPQHFPAAGEIVIFDRSWYNRAGIEYVMGFCTKEQQRRFLELCPLFEKFIVDFGIRLIKYWLEVGDEEQKKRFEARIEDPTRLW
jgi:hypothetical protein